MKPWSSPLGLADPAHRARAPQAGPLRLLGLIALSSLLLALAPLPSLAHPTGDSHLRLQLLPQQQLAVQWDLSLRDLDDELLLDTDEDGHLSAQELAPRWAEVLAWAQTQLAVQSARGACTVAPEGASPSARAHAPGAIPALWRHDDGVHARLRWRLQCPDLNALTVQYKALSPTPDSPHRAVVRLTGPGPMQRVLMGGPVTRHTFRLNNAS